MNVITIQSEVFEILLKHIRRVEDILEYLNTKDTIETNWLSVEETCQVLKISRRTFFTFKEKGILPYSQVGNKLYIKRSDIIRVLMQNYSQSV